MCLFSSEVEHVADTRIFARADGDHQYLAYQMQLRSQRELAMILPLPTHRPVTSGRWGSSMPRTPTTCFASWPRFFWHHSVPRL